MPDQLIPTDVSIAQLEEFLRMNGVGPEINLPGGMAGISPTGAFPFLGQATRAQERVVRNQNLMRQVNQVSQRNLYINQLLAGSEDVSDGANQTARQLIGAVFNNPAFSPFVGGSDLSLAFGLQNAVQSSRFRMGDTRVFGAGPVSDQLAIDLYKQADKFFFDGGYNQLQRTSGFDRTEVGQIFTLMGQRGAFAGMNVGFDSATGKYQVSDFDATAKQVNDAVSKMTEPLRLLRDVVGPKEMGELVAIAEGLSGISVGVKNAEQQIKQTLSRAIANSEALGLDARAYLNNQANIVQGYRQLGFSDSSAAAFAEGTNAFAQRAAIASQDAAQRSSFFMPVVTAAKAGAAMITQTAAAMEEPKMQAYAYGLLMMQNRLGSDSDLSRLRALYANSAPSEQNLDEIARAVDSAAGGNVLNTIAKFGGVQRVMNILNSTNKRTLATTSQNTMMSRGLNQRLESNLLSLETSQVRSIVGNDAMTSSAIEMQVWAASTLENANRDKLMTILEGPGTEAELRTQLREVLAQDAGAKLDPGSVERRVSGLIRQRPFFGRMTRLAQSVQTIDPASPNAMSVGDRLRDQERVAKGYSVFEDMTATYDSRSYGGMLGNFLRGLRGQETISDTEVMRYAQMQRANRLLAGEKPTSEKMLDELVNFGVQQEGMVDGVGRFSLELFTKGTKEQKDNQRTVLRTIMTDAGLKGRELNEELTSYTNDFMAGGLRSANAYEKLISLTSGRGRQTPNTTGTLDYVTKQRAEDIRKVLESGRSNESVYQMMDILGLTTSEEKEAYKNNTFADKPLPKERLETLVTGLSSAKWESEHRSAWTSLIERKDNRDRLLPIVEAQRQAALDDWQKNRDKYETKDGYTKEGEKARARLDQLDEMKSAATGNMFTGEIVIRNLHQAWLKFSRMQNERGTASSGS